MSDIRVFVTFSQPGGAVFAGETLECKIVFKNVSPSAAANRPQPPPLSVLNGHGDRRTRPSNLSTAQVVERTRASVINPQPPTLLPAGSGLHTRRQSVSVPFTGPKLPIPLPSSSQPPPPQTAPTPTAIPSTPITNGEATPTQSSIAGKGHKHKRSISIISIGPDAGTDDAFSRQQQTPLSARRPGLNKGHGRSASLQIPARRNGQTPGGTPLLPSATWPIRPSQPGTPSPSTPAIREGQEGLNGFGFPPPPTPTRRASAANFNGHATPLTPATPSVGGRGKGLGINNAFKFPVSPSTPTSNPNPPIPEQEPLQAAPTIIEATSLNPPKSITNIDLKSTHEDSESEVAGPTSSIAVIRNLNNLDTPRSSSDFYSHPNSTTDTLVSEYDRSSQATSKIMRSPRGRRHSLLGMATKQPETLMMGYAQVSGSFILDGSLMQTALFDEIKRKGVVGGQRGGGVVGIDTKKSSEGGLLGGFGWGGFGISSLLGSGNMSTIAEMKSIASSKSIPILSTPQSILFVDLRLAPGESKTYSYNFLLPETLPPSHRGKAIKIVYNLVIGTQRPGKGVQHPKTVEIPFRVFPHVKPNGTLYLHDLMSPIIQLRDTATTTCLDEDISSTSSASSKQLIQIPMPRKANEPTMNDFLHYVGSLMTPQSNTPLTGQTLSVPFSQALPTPIRPSMSEEITSKDAIEATILRSGYSQGGRGGLFEIARNGRKVASLTLSRPAYKLGETITAVINFSNAEIPCYHIHSSLETSEAIDPALALRSPTSIHRATRRIHSHHAESTIFSKRVTLTPTIPATASPEFSTSGISVSWTLRIEFITPILSNSVDIGEGLKNEELLEMTSNDSRGEIWEARQGLYVESFDAAIPVRVYPNPSEMGFAGGQPPGTGFVV